ncbi:hypothetical protein [Hymenobacter psychrotolerans]|uniref:Uncharacterized protein n=1 Tax=Hymenobacter psychrotolerans DSM 18569 TaxID=1121959 RepID=A0A1M6XBD7_9BACT|nr:hypothetical protein [Hymenobacter psychrotolerans]SHL03264.1 hypothetical protein SAMN02746009_01993 [Hymenobacter psychrotolerans DSM 18569]
MPSSALTELRLHLVPAGCRLDFPRLPRQFAYIYRRHHNLAWECIAHNACSPHLDRNPPTGALVEYKVCYCDAAGTITASSPVVQIQTHPTGMPTNSTLLGLR